MPLIPLDLYMQYLERTGRSPEPDPGLTLMEPENAERIEQIPSIDAKQFDAELRKKDLNWFQRRGVDLQLGMGDLEVGALNFAGWLAKKRPANWRKAMALPGVVTQMAAVDTIADWVKSTPVGEKIRDSLLAYRMKIQEEQASIAEQTYGPGGPEGGEAWWHAAFRTAPNMLAMIGASALTGGVAGIAGASTAGVATAAAAGGGAFTAIQTAVNKAPELEAAGYSQEQAEALAQGLGLAVGGLEMIGVGKIVGYVGPWWKRTLSGMVAEGMTEFLQSGTEGVADRVLGLSDADGGEILRNALFEASIGMVYGGAAGAAMVRSKVQIAVDFMVDKKIVNTPEEARSFIHEYLVRQAELIVNQGVDLANLKVEHIKSVRNLIAKANGIKQAMSAADMPDIDIEGAQAPVEQDIPPEKRLEVEAAVREIDQTMKNIDKRIEEMMAEEDFNFEDVEEALVEKDKLEQSRADLLAGATIKGSVTTKASKIADIRLRGIRDKVKSFNAGAKSARREMKEIKKFLRDYIKNIPVKGQAKTVLLNDMRRASESIRSVEDLEAKKGYIEQKIKDSLELLARDQYAKAIELKLGKKNVSPEAMRILEKFEEAYNHPYMVDLVEVDPKATEDERKLQELTQIYQEMGSLAGSGDASLRQMRDIAEGVAEMYEIGVAGRKEWVRRQSEIIDKGVGTIVKALESKAPIVTDDLHAQALELDKRLRATFKEATVNNPMFTNLYRMIDILDMHTASEPGQGPVMKLLNPFIHARVFEAEFNYRSRKLWQDFADVYNEGQRKGVDKLARDMESQRVYTLYQGVKFDVDGTILEAKPHQITRTQAIAFWLMAKNPDVETKLRKAQWDVESLQAQIAERFKGKDLAFAERIDALYRSYRDRIGEVYERATGKPATLLKEYFPLSYVAGADNVKTLETMINSMATGEFRPLDAADTDHLKERLGSDKMPKIPSALATTMQYMYDMEYFLAHGPYLRNVYEILGRDEVRGRIEKREGKVFYNRMMEYFHTIGRGGLAREFRFSSINVNRWISKYALSRIGGTVPFDKHFFMQLTGTISAANEIGYRSMIAEFPGFINAIRTGEIHELTKTEMYRNRFGDESAFDPDLRDLQAAMTDSPTVKKMLRYFLTNVRWGDQAAFTWAMWTEYKKGQKAGLSKEAAAVKAMEMASITNQSTDLYMAPLGAQSTNPFSRLVWTFRRMPSQLLNNYLMTWQNAFNGRVRGKEGKASSMDIAWALTRNVFTYHFLLPYMIEFIRTGNDIDDEQLFYSMLAGPAAEMFLVADLFQIVFNGLWGARSRERDSMSSTLYSSIIRDVNTIVESATDLTYFIDELTVSELLEAAGSLGSVAAGGVPVGDIAREVYAIANPNMSSYTDWRDLLGRGLMYLLDYPASRIDGGD